MKNGLRRAKRFIITLIMVAIPSMWINLFLHEGGHALAGVLTGNEVKQINLGISNPHVYIEINNEYAIPYIAIASFILPLVVSGLLLFIDNEIINIFNIINIVVTIFNISINVMAILSMPVPVARYKYDLEQFVESSDISPTIVSWVAITLVFITCIYLFYLIRKVLYKAIIQ